MSLLLRAIRAYRRDGLVPLLKYTSNYLKRVSTEPAPRHRPGNLLWEIRHEPDRKIISEDWDNLLILDACRYDAFRERNFIDGSLQKRTSIASNTTTFLKRNFLKEELYDTVYLTANPKGLKLENGVYGSEQIFHATISLLDYWDEDTYTVLPGDVAEATLEAQERYPNKRLIIHFVQPHLPYIGKKAEELRKHLGQQLGGWNLNRDFLDYDVDNFDILSFEVLEDDSLGITREDLWDAYIETLDITLQSVSELVSQLDGRTIITSDHGEMFGKRAYPFGPKIYTHPKRVKTTGLRDVPWFIIEGESRRKTTSDPPIDTEVVDNKVIEERLEQLGYTS